MDHAAPGRVGTNPVHHIQRWLTKEAIRPLRFQAQQGALDCPHTGCRDIAILIAQLGSTVRYVLQHGAQILQVQNQLALVVCQTKDDIENPFLGIVQLQNLGQQQRPHVGNRGPDRMALLAKNIPEGDRVRPPGWLGQAQLLQTLLQLGIGLGGL